MPYSSDSEAFESADEDFVDESKTASLEKDPKSKHKVIPKPTDSKPVKTAEVPVNEQKESKQQFPVLSSSIPDKERLDAPKSLDVTVKKLKETESLFPVSGRSSPTEEKLVQEDVALVTVKTLDVAVHKLKKTQSNFPISGRSSPVQSDDQLTGIVEDVEHLIKLEKGISQQKLEFNASREPVKIEASNPDEEENIEICAILESQMEKFNSPKKPEVVKTTDDAGWEFDDWGDETESTKKKAVDAEPISKPTEDEDVGWEVDDWGDEDASSFPVESKSDTRKELPSTASKNLLGNLSQMLISSDDSSKKVDDFKQPAVPLVNPLDRLTESSDSSSNWGWKPWGGVVNLLSTASDGVASITSHVSSVIESGIGVPDPSEMARIQQQERKKQLQEQPESEVAKKESSKPTRGDDASLLLGQFVSGMTQISNRVITGGLDTLEGIGKKTMTILKENDQGLLSKQRKMMMDGQGPVLSQILREAKDKTEEAEKNLQLLQKQQYKKQLHFETLFDDYHGLVHLEALEMLSRQSALKLQSLIAPLAGRALEDVQETLDEVKELCELNDSDSEDSDGTHSVEELQQKINEALEDLDVPIDFKELLECWKQSAEWLQDDKQIREPQAIHDKSLRCLAETTAHAVHKMHKLAELLLIKERHSTANEADSLVQLTTTFCWHLSGIAARFGAALSRLDNEEETNSLITSTFLEGSNSILYIQNAFQLFIPILQIGAA